MQANFTLPTFKTGVDQVKLITNLNKYLEWNNSPYRLNQSGICNGLATMHAKYSLEGRQDDFFKLLASIANMKPNAGARDDINEFVLDVLKTYNPEFFNLELSQSRAIEMLNILGHPLKSSFNVAMITNDDNWSDIIKQIELRNGEAMQISSANHAVTVTKNKNKYVLYDPNYSSGYKEFAHEKDMVYELHHNVFGASNRLEDFAKPLGLEGLTKAYKPMLDPVSNRLEINNPLALSLSVICNPIDNRSRTFPDPIALYLKYLPSEKMNLTTRYKDKTMTQLQLSAINDRQQYPYVLQHWSSPPQKEEELLDALLASIRHNNMNFLSLGLKTLQEQLSPEKQSSYLGTCIQMAVLAGRKDAFETILKHTNKQVVCDQLMTVQSLLYAVNGRNVDLLNTLLHASSHKLTDKIILDTATHAIASHKSKNDAGTATCLTTLMSHLKEPLSEKQLLTFLTASIKENKLDLVNHFVNEIKNTPEHKAIFNTIRVNVAAVEKMNIGILKTLQTAGVPFSPQAQAIIQHKSQEHKPIDYLLKIGIALSKFTDFIKTTVQNKEQVRYNHNALNQIKEKLHTMKNQDVNSDNKEEPRPFKT